MKHVCHGPKYMLAAQKQYSVSQHRQHEIEETINQLQEEKQDLWFNGWWSKILAGALRDQIQAHYPGLTVELCGPFGLGSHMLISVYEDNITTSYDDHYSQDNFTGSITICPGDLDEGELRLVNTKENTNQYSQGTLGAVNGLNHPI